MMLMKSVTIAPSCFNHLPLAIPVDLKNGAIVVQIHGSFCSPVKDVACQDAFYKRSQPDFWGGLVQLIQQVWQHL